MSGRSENWSPAYYGGGYYGQSSMPKVQKSGMAGGQAGGLMLRGIVANVYVYDSEEGYTTTSTSANKLNTLYADVLLVSEPGGMLPRCEILQERTGMHEGSIWVPRATSVDITGAPINPEFASNLFNLDGDYVVVGFMEDDLSQPIIIGCLPHPSSDKDHDGDDLGTRMRLVDSDGEPRYWKHRGVYWGVDDCGNFVLDLTKGHEGLINQDGTEAPPSEDGSGGNLTYRLQKGAVYEVILGSNSIKFTESDGKIELLTAGKIYLGTGADEAVVQGDKFKSATDAYASALDSAITNYNTAIAPTLLAPIAKFAPPAGSAAPVTGADLYPTIFAWQTSLLALFTEFKAAAITYAAASYLSEDVSTK